MSAMVLSSEEEGSMMGYWEILDGLSAMLMAMMSKLCLLVSSCLRGSGSVATGCSLTGMKSSLCESMQKPSTTGYGFSSTCFEKSKSSNFSRLSRLSSEKMLFASLPCGFKKGLFLKVDLER